MNPRRRRHNRHARSERSKSESARIIIGATKEEWDQVVRNTDTADEYLFAWYMQYVMRQPGGFEP